MLVNFKKIFNIYYKPFYDIINGIYCYKGINNTIIWAKDEQIYFIQEKYNIKCHYNTVWDKIKFDFNDDLSPIDLKEYIKYMLDKEFNLGYLEPSKSDFRVASA